MEAAVALPVTTCMMLSHETGVLRARCKPAMQKSALGCCKITDFAARDVDVKETAKASSENPADDPRDGDMSQGNAEERPEQSPEDRGGPGTSEQGKDVQSQEEAPLQEASSSEMDDDSVDCN
eukprot:gene7236-8619_t